MGSLATYFRTPVDVLALADRRVTFNAVLYVGENGSGAATIRAPYACAIHAVAFDGPVLLDGLFLGSLNPFGCAPYHGLIATSDFTPQAFGGLVLHYSRSIPRPQRTHNCKIQSVERSDEADR